MEKPFGLIFVVVVLSLVLNIYWLAGLVALAGFFMILSSIEIRKPLPAPTGGAGKEEVLTPVIVQDVGEPPYLYPPDFRLKLRPNWYATPMWEDAIWGLASLFKSGIRIARGDRLQRRRFQIKSWKWRDSYLEED